MKPSLEASFSRLKEAFYKLANLDKPQVTREAIGMTPDGTLTAGGQQVAASEATDDLATGQRHPVVRSKGLPALVLHNQARRAKPQATLGPLMEGVIEELGIFGGRVWLRTADQESPLTLDLNGLKPEEVKWGTREDSFLVRSGFTYFTFIFDPGFTDDGVPNGLVTKRGRPAKKIQRVKVEEAWEPLLQLFEVQVASKVDTTWWSVWEEEYCRYKATWAQMEGESEAPADVISGLVGKDISKFPRQHLQRTPVFAILLNWFAPGPVFYTKPHLSMEWFWFGPQGTWDFSRNSHSQGNSPHFPKPFGYDYWRNTEQWWFYRLHDGPQLNKAYTHDATVPVTLTKAFLEAGIIRITDAVLDDDLNLILSLRVQAQPAVDAYRTSPTGQPFVSTATPRDVARYGAVKDRYPGTWTPSEADLAGRDHYNNPLLYAHITPIAPTTLTGDQSACEVIRWEDIERPAVSPARGVAAAPIASRILFGDIIYGDLFVPDPGVPPPPPPPPHWGKVPKAPGHDPDLGQPDPERLWHDPPAPDELRYGRHLVVTDEDPTPRPVPAAPRQPNQTATGPAEPPIQYPIPETHLVIVNRTGKKVLFSTAQETGAQVTWDYASDGMNGRIHTDRSNYENHGWIVLSWLGLSPSMYVPTDWPGWQWDEYQLCRTGPAVDMDWKIQETEAAYTALLDTAFHPVTGTKRAAGREVRLVEKSGGRLIMRGNWTIARPQLMHRLKLTDELLVTHDREPKTVWWSRQHNWLPRYAQYPLPPVLEPFFYVHYLLLTYKATFDQRDIQSRAPVEFDGLFIPGRKRRKGPNQPEGYGGVDFNPTDSDASSGVVTHTILLRTRVRFPRVPADPEKPATTPAHWGLQFGAITLRHDGERYVDHLEAPWPYGNVIKSSLEAPPNVAVVGATQWHVLYLLMYQPNLQEAVPGAPAKDPEWVYELRLAVTNRPDLMNTVIKGTYEQVEPLLKVGIEMLRPAALYYPKPVAPPSAVWPMTTWTVPHDRFVRGWAPLDKEGTPTLNYPVVPWTEALAGLERGEPVPTYPPLRKEIPPKATMLFRREASKTQKPVVFPPIKISDKPIEWTTSVLPWPRGSSFHIFDPLKRRDLKNWMRLREME